MKIFRYNILILIAFFISQAAIAQTVLTGKVTDEKSEPLMGANVYVMNQNNRSLAGTMVSDNGQYRLVIPSQPNLRIVFSFIGYKTQIVNFSGQGNINMILEEEAHTMEVVEITAKKAEKNSVGLTVREQVSATQKITLERLETAPVTSVAEALQGAMANVDILTGADPGSKTSIRIRGTASLNANTEPLFVVDGVAYPVDVTSDFNFSTANSDDYGALLNISPNDIESVEVLKDAAATAVWGSKGANGVLIFKTKKGTKGKIKFTAASKYEFRKEPNTIPMLNSNGYVGLMNEAINNSINDYGRNSNISLGLQTLQQSKEIGVYPAWLYYDEYNQNTNWLDEITRTAYSIDNSFSMSGGGEKANYRLSLGYARDEGITIGTQYDRINAMFSVQYKFSDKLDISTDIKYTAGIRLANWANPRGEALTKMPNMSPYYINENGSRSDVYFTPNSYFQGTFALKDDEIKGRFNPVALVNKGENKTTSNTSRVLFNLHYKAFRDLDYFGIVGIDIESNRHKAFLPQEATGVTYVNPLYNLYTDGLTDKFVLNTENKLIYNKLFNENHKLLLSGIFQTREQISTGYMGETSGIPSSAIPVSEYIQGMGSGQSTARELGFIANAHYTLFDKYMFNVGYRLEANSSIGPNNRVGGFPILGVAWQLGDEKFIKDIPAISLAKVRVSWGQSGNTPGGSYPYIGIYSPITPGYIDMSPIEPATIQLNNLKWETVTQTNGGIDIGFFDSKLTASVDVYYKLTTDLLQKDVKLPSSTGYVDINYYNSGSMSNKGWEVFITWDAYKTADWGVQFNMNLAQNINKIIELPANQIAENYSFDNANYAKRVIEGDPLGSFYGYKCEGVYQNIEETYARDAIGNKITDVSGESVFMRNGGERVFPGDAKYKDLNSDGIINQYDIVYLGNAMPKTTGGFGINLRYKNLGLVASFHGRLGQKVINQVRMDMENMYATNNQSLATLRRWRKEGDDTNIPRALYNKGYNYLGSDRFVEDGSFLRMKTLTLKYALPKLFVQRAGLTRADIYVTAYDLWTITGYTGQDPEVGLDKNLALDKATTPKPVRIACGILLNF